MAPVMRELSLFSGAGGGLLGSKLLGWKAIGYVEINDYCQRVLKARIQDDILDEAPIFSDIRAFIREGYAQAYSGLVDIVTAGFPCQPFSVTGKGSGECDPRNMWPETIESLRIIRPRFALFENVPGLLSDAYGRTIFRDLAESGYQCRWRILSAAELGAPHKRDRLWIVAYSDADGFQRFNPLRSAATGQKEEWSDIARVACEIQQGKRDCVPASWILGKDSGLPHRVDRTKALGNGQVPAVVRSVWQVLTSQA